MGIPGRVIERSDDARTQRRADTAARIGFDAYGATRDAPDPVANAINRMLDHIHIVDQRIEAMSAALERNGITGHFDHLPELARCALDPGCDDEAPPQTQD